MADRRRAAALAFGWAVTLLGVLVTLATLGGSLYVIVGADSTEHFLALIVASLFFAAFPALMGLGLVIWGRKLVIRSRSGNSRVDGDGSRIR